MRGKGLRKKNQMKSLLTLIITTVILINPIQQASAQDNMSQSGVLDESLADLTLVLGAGAAGAVLGLSTLSFVDKPKDHFKNIAIGGAIGIVLGVGIAVFGQATKSQTVVVDAKIPLDSNSVESFARADFSKQRIAENYLTQPTVGYNFSF